MAMDQIGSINKHLKVNIMRNIGNTFIKLGQFVDAIQSYEMIAETMPDAKTAFNLIICYYAIGDKEKMKRGFVQLLNVKTRGDNAIDEENNTIKDELSIYLQKQFNLSFIFMFCIHIFHTHNTYHP